MTRRKLTDQEMLDSIKLVAARADGRWSLARHLRMAAKIIERLLDQPPEPKGTPCWAVQTAPVNGKRTMHQPHWSLDEAEKALKWCDDMRPANAPHRIVKGTFVPEEK